MVPAMTRNRIEEGASPQDCEKHHYNVAEQNSLRRLAASPNIADAKLCFDYLFAASEFTFDEGDFNRNGLLIVELADALIPSRSNRIRWGTLSLLSPFCESHPEQLWPLVVKWGPVRSEDIRGGVACCVLEHILEYNFRAYFERCKQIILSGNKRFVLTLSTCAKFGQAEEPVNSAAFDAFLASVSTP